MRSMTGYGEATGLGKTAKVTVQVRTVNHRHLDIQVRAPREYFSMEEEARRVVRQEVTRGRIEIWITRTPVHEKAHKMEMDEELVRQYVRSLQRIQKTFKLKGDLDLPLISRLPELFRFQEKAAGGQSEASLLFRALRVALKNLKRSREREGRHLLRDIWAQILRLQAVQSALEVESEKIRGRLLESAALLKERAPMEAIGDGLETAGGSFKGDIHEEIVRLKSHVKEVALLVRRERDPIGKKLEFLLQEVHRELNTIGAKAPQLEVLRWTLEGKERVEKIREQAQNVE